MDLETGEQTEKEGDYLGSNGNPSDMEIALVPTNRQM